MPYIYKKPYCEFGKLVYDVGTEKCRCRIKTKKIKKKIKTATKTEKCSAKKKEECALKNKICNEKTNRCNNPPKTVKKKKKKKTVKRKQKTEVIKTITPSLRQSIVKLEKKMDSIKKDEYSPSVNKKLLTLREITPKSYIHNCDGMDIVVKIKNKNKCMKWTSKKAKKVLLDNLLSNRPIKCDNIIAPKQFQSNCWMNTFFMAWFVSDKGRKFNRWFRQTMITGLDPDGKKINKKLKKPLWLLNKMIDASIYGSRIGDNGVRFSSLMDTNEIIRLIFMVDPKNLVKTKTAFNPFTFYKSIYNLLPGNFLSWGMIRFGGDGKFITSKNEATAEMSNTFNTWHNNNILPKVLFVSYSDTVSSVEKQQSIKFIFNEKEKITYKLDAVIIRNIKKHHFSACITCSGKEYGFDGASYSPMQPFKWKNKLNKDVKWRFAEQHNMFFNFKEGYQMLMYYRV